MSRPGGSDFFLVFNLLYKVQRLNFNKIYYFPRFQGGGGGGGGGPISPGGMGPTFSRVGVEVLLRIPIDSRFLF